MSWGVSSVRGVWPSAVKRPDAPPPASPARTGSLRPLCQDRFTREHSTKRPEGGQGWQLTRDRRKQRALPSTMPTKYHKCHCQSRIGANPESGSREAGRGCQCAAQCVAMRLCRVRHPVAPRGAPGISAARDPRGAGAKRPAYDFPSRNRRRANSRSAASARRFSTSRPSSAASRPRSATSALRISASRPSSAASPLCSASS